MRHTISRTPKMISAGLIGLITMTVLLSACGNTRTLTYMQGSFDTAKLSQVKIPEPIIQKGDLLSIIVYSDNPEATKLYNQTLINSASANPGGAANSSVMESLPGTSPTAPGYLVDENGNIELQKIGLLHVDSMTREILKDTLDRRLTAYLTNPYYTIRFLNRHYTMLGEIGKPGIYSISGDRINLLEALGVAGDMTFYGRRDNVLFIRETNGKRQFARLDLTKPEIIASPYFYLQQNDVIIFEANKKKIAANDQTVVRNVSIAATIISVFAIVYSIFRN
jgi:polysaccharide export outer membrane protein